MLAAACMSIKNIFVQLLGRGRHSGETFGQRRCQFYDMTGFHVLISVAVSDVELNINVQRMCRFGHAGH